MARHAIINDKGEVVNVIEWDGASPWSPPEGHFTIESEVCDRLDIYDKDKEHFLKNNGKQYHRSCKYADYIQGLGHIES